MPNTNYTPILKQHQIIGRKEAKEAGMKYYFTGTACKYGHISKRRVRNYECDDCYREGIRKLCDPERPKRNKKRVSEITHEKAEERRAAAREYYAKNARKILDSNKKYLSKNKSNYKLSVYTRRARIKGVGGTHNHKDIMELIIMQFGRCGNHRCMVELSSTGYHVDHIVPLSKGGDNWPTNLQILCPTCNRRKGSKMPEEWM